MASLRRNNLPEIKASEPTLADFKAQLDRVMKEEVFQGNISIFNILLVSLTQAERDIENIESTILTKIKSQKHRDSFRIKCRSLAMHYFHFRDFLKQRNQDKEIAELNDLLIATRKKLEENKESKTYAQQPKLISMPKNSEDDFNDPFYSLALDYLQPDSPHTIPKGYEATIDKVNELILNFRHDVEPALLNKNILNTDCYCFLPEKLIHYKHLIDKLIEELAYNQSSANQSVGEISNGLFTLQATILFKIIQYEVKVKAVKKTNLSEELHEILKTVTKMETLFKNPQRMKKIHSSVVKFKSAETQPAHRLEMAEYIRNRKTIQALDFFPGYFKIEMGKLKTPTAGIFETTYTTLLLLLRQLFAMQNPTDKTAYGIFPLRGAFTNQTIMRRMLQVMGHFLDLFLITPSQYLKDFFHEANENEKPFQQLAVILLENYAFLKSKKQDSATIQNSLTSLDYFLRLLNYLEEHGLGRSRVDNLLMPTLLRVFPNKLNLNKEKFEEFLSTVCQTLKDSIPNPRDEFKDYDDKEINLEIRDWEEQDRAISDALEKEKQALVKAARDEKARKIKNRKKKDLKQKKDKKDDENSVSPHEEKKPSVEPPSEQRKLYLDASTEFLAQKIKDFKEHNFSEARNLYMQAEKLARTQKDHTYVAYALSGIAETYLAEAITHLKSAKINLTAFYHIFEEGMLPQYQEDLNLAQKPYEEAIKYAKKAIDYFDTNVFADKDSLSRTVKQQLDDISWGLKQVLNTTLSEMTETKAFVKNHIAKMESRLAALERSRELAIRRKGYEAWKNNQNPTNFYSDRRKACEILLESAQPIDENFIEMTTQMEEPLAQLDVLQPNRIKSLKAPEGNSETFLERLTDLHQFIANGRLKDNNAPVLALLPPNPSNESAPSENKASLMSLAPSEQNDEEEKVKRSEDRANVSLLPKETKQVSFEVKADDAPLVNSSVQPQAAERKRPAVAPVAVAPVAVAPVAVAPAPAVAPPIPDKAHDNLYDFEEAESKSFSFNDLLNIPIPDKEERAKVLAEAKPKAVNRSGVTVVRVTNVPATMYSFNHRKSNNQSYQLTETLMALEDAYRWNKDQALKEAALAKFINFWEFDKFDNTCSPSVLNNFKGKIINGMRHDRLARLNINVAFLIGCMKFIGVEFPEAKAFNHFTTYDYFNFVTGFKVEVDNPIYLTSLLFLTRKQADEIPYKELLIRQKNKLTKKDIIIENFKTLAGEGIPLANVFLGRFYEKLASFEEANRDNYLQKAKACYEAAKKDDCSFAKPHIELLDEEGGLYPRTAMR